MTTALLAFALTATLLILAPGPDSLLVMRNTLRAGRRAGPTAQRRVERVTAVVLIGFGLRLAAEAR